VPLNYSDGTGSKTFLFAPSSVACHFVSYASCKFRGKTITITIAITIPTRRPITLSVKMVEMNSAFHYRRKSGNPLKAKPQVGKPRLR